MTEWIVTLAVFVAFALGVYVGWRWHRHTMLTAIRNLAKQQPAAEAPIDHDAMFRIIKQHQGDR